MTALLAILCLILIAIIAVQIGKVTELASKIRGEEDVEESNNRRQSRYLLIFMILFLVACVWSALYYKNFMLGFGPHQSASEHGGSLDYMFKVTTFFTGIVFFITQIALFYFSYRYRSKKDGKASYLPHDNKLEIIWTAVPAVVMTFLVIGGLDAWNDVMADVGGDDDFIQVEATGYQFAWQLRYPGPDGELGQRDYTLISGVNPLGQDWKDEANLDDLQPNELWLPVGKKVRVRITARDVLHDFYLPHFRVKMDAVPGMPTYFVFTPTKTTVEYRQELSQYPEYQVPDPNNPDKQLWETFEYELACAELCGKGHWSMRKIVKIVSEEEYQNWLSQQQSYYLSTIYNTDGDPWKGSDELPGIVSELRKEEFNTAFETALADSINKTFVLQYVTFQTGSAELTELSRKYELQNVVAALKENTNLRIELGGHTDNTGDADANVALSQARAEAVKSFLVANGIAAERLTAVGYGDREPLGDNGTDAGRAQNRRTEFTILAQ